MDQAATRRLHPMTRIFNAFLLPGEKFPILPDPIPTGEFPVMDRKFFRWARPHKDFR
jgi:hypothetical protein